MLRPWDFGVNILPPQNLAIETALMGPLVYHMLARMCLYATFNNKFLEIRLVPHLLSPRSDYSTSTLDVKLDWLQGPNPRMLVSYRRWHRILILPRYTDPLNHL